MELQEFVRRPFPVKAVEVNFNNAYEIAEWCRGRVELKETRLMGGAGKGVMELPTVVFKGTGDNRDKEFTAGLGDWIVELRGNFRVFKKAQFKATFEPVKVKKEWDGDGVLDKSPSVDDETESVRQAIVDGVEPQEYRDSEDEALANQEREDAEHRHGHDNSSVDGQETVHVSL